MLTDKIKQLRCQKGLSQEELAERLGVVRQTISKWEKGLSAPDSDMLVSIAAEFDITVSELLEEQVIEKEITQTENITIDSSNDKNKSSKALRLTLIILGLPLWLPLLIAAFAIALSLLVSLWAVIVSLWAVQVSLVAGILCGAVGGIQIIIDGNIPAGLVFVAMAFVCAGLSIFMHYVCQWATKGALRLTKKAVWLLIRCFTRRKHNG